MVWIFDPLDTKSDESGFGDPVSAAARNGSVDWANFIEAEFHNIVSFVDRAEFRS